MQAWHESSWIDSSVFFPASDSGRALACTNSIENMMGTVRRVCRNVKRWRDATMALRWTAAAMLETAKGFRRLKAYKRLPAPRAALAVRHAKYAIKQEVEPNAEAAYHHPLVARASPLPENSCIFSE